MKELTKKQEVVLSFIKKFIAENGYSPTVREICKGVGLSSTATAHVHIHNMEDLGYLKTNKSKFRTLELLVNNEYVQKNEDVVKIPLLGKVTAGNPITAIENPDEYFSVPSALIPKNAEVFALHVSGESMVNAGIFDSDYIIVKRSSEAQNGEIVVAMTEENEVTLKRFYKEKNQIRLQPENDSMAPIILPNCTILGKAIGLYRSI